MTATVWQLCLRHVYAQFLLLLDSMWYGNPPQYPRTECAVLRIEQWINDVWHLADAILQDVVAILTVEKWLAVSRTGKGNPQSRRASSEAANASLKWQAFCVVCVEGPDFKLGDRLFLLLHGIIQSLQPYSGLVLHNRLRHFHFSIRRRTISYTDGVLK